MSKGKRIYILTNQIKNKILTASAVTIQRRIAGRVYLIHGRLKTITCKRCSKEINIGDAVVSSRAKRRQNLYHVNCALSVNLI